jgi:hypothetical protein
LGLAFSFCPVHPSTKTSLNLWKWREVSSM